MAAKANDASWNDYLVTADQKVQLVVLQEVTGDIWAEAHTHASLTGAPPLSWFGVTPQHFTHQAVLRRLPVHVHIPSSADGNL